MLILFLTNQIFAHQGPDIAHLETKIKCDETMMMKHVVDVTKSQAQTDLQVGFTLEHLSKSFQSGDRIHISDTCDGKASTSSWDVNCQGGSCYISGDRFDAGSVCGTLADLRKFDEYVDYYGFKDLFVSPPKNITKSYTVEIARSNIESETYSKLAKCTMNIVDDPKPETVEEPPAEENKEEETQAAPSNNNTSPVTTNEAATKALPPKMFHAQVTVPMLPADTLKQRIKKKGRTKLKEKAAKQGYTKQVGNVLVPNDPDCVIKENKCTAKVKAKFEQGK